MLDPTKMREVAEAKMAREVKELLLEVQSAAYGYATTYTTVIIFGAYAALFTVWTQSKDALSEHATALVAMLMGISVMTFVGFEVFKMMVISREFMRVRELLVKEHSPSVLLKKRADLARSQNLFVQRVILPIWVVVLVVSVITGFGAGFVLLGAHFSNLWTTSEVPALPA